ncbi:MAG: sulfurtransferase [Gammaproteobacteria bacterium]|nr:sulfurtransferase [Gammaproteobacteria bacterium]
MIYSSVISADLLQQHLADPAWRIVDCRFNLKAPDEGMSLYRMEHIPNAVYAHLERDLSAPVNKTSGRHPLPDVNPFKRKLGAWGITHNTQVAVYDDAAGSYAARLWWMLRWLGHEAVAILDGGFTAWKRQGLPTTAVVPHFNAVTFTGEPDIKMQVDSNTLERHLRESGICLVDVRDERRYLGLEEPIDRIAGHIPGAINIPWKTNIDDNSLFLTKAQLYDQYRNILCDTDGENIVFMCGSGVTACHSLAVLNYIGVSGARLYPGSWSEWITDPSRPVEKSKE